MIATKGGNDDEAHLFAGAARYAGCRWYRGVEIEPNGLRMKPKPSVVTGID